MTINPTRLWLPVSSVTLAAGAMLIAGIISSTPKPSAAGAFTARAIMRMLEPELHDVDREVRRVGLTPQALAAAGVDASGTTALLNRAVAHLDSTNYTSLCQAMEAHGSAKAALDSLQRAFRAGTQGEATQQDLDNAVALEASTRATMEARQEDLYDAATDGVNGDILGRLAHVKAEAAMAYPEYFKVAERTHAQCIALRDALNGVRIDTKLGVEPSEYQQDIIDAELDTPAIAAAKTASDANMDAIVAAWKGVLEPE